MTAHHLAGLFGGLDLGGGFSGVQGLEQSEEAGSFPDAAELDAECLNLDEEVLHVNDLVPYQRLEEDADQPDQTVLRKHQQTETDGVTVSCSSQTSLSHTEVEVRSNQRR